MALKCGGCLKTITNREFLTCALCKNKYDLNCAQVSVQRFRNTLTPERKKKWKCPFCYYGTPVNRNEAKQLPETSNITIRTNKNKKTKTLNETDSSMDTSKLGDTLPITPQNSPVAPVKEKEEPLTLANIQQLLQMNNKYIMSEFKSVIESEMKIILTELRKENIEAINIKNDELPKEIHSLNNKIQTLNHQCLSLKTEINTLLSEIEKINETKITTTTNPDTTKIFVLHGLIENQWETEEEIHGRIIHAMQVILDIDLTGYIDDISRIGTKSPRRPIRVELISKRVTNYILQNAKCFKNTGLAVSRLLDEQSLRERHQLRAALLSARRNGKHAVIYNNKLHIDGKETNIHDFQKSTTTTTKKVQPHQKTAPNHSSNEKTNLLQPFITSGETPEYVEANKRDNENNHISKQQHLLDDNQSQDNFRDF